MKKGLIATGIAMVLLLVGLITRDVQVSYRYKNEVHSYWSLAEKASTIERKAEYIDKFVTAYEKSNATGYNALVFKTPDNSIEQNLAAVKSLQQRLHEIQTMDVRSFEYQTAIQQITAQEQGEAHGILDELEGGWLLHGGYWYLWSYIEFLESLGLFVAAIAAFVLSAEF